MIEVLFAAVYLAIGLLGIAAMQDIALSRNVDAKRLSVATNLAVEMLERVRYNAPANSTAPYPYNNFKVCNYSCSGGETPSAPSTAITNATARGDYNQWKARLSATDSSGQMALPNAVGTVTSSGPFGTTALGQVQVTVTVQWTSGLRQPTVTMSTIVAPL
jgi:type IV pilus modification protein PilV